MTYIRIYIQTCFSKNICLIYYFFFFLCLSPGLFEQQLLLNQAVWVACFSYQHRATCSAKEWSQNPGIMEWNWHRAKFHEAPFPKGEALGKLNKHCNSSLPQLCKVKMLGSSSMPWRDSELSSQPLLTSFLGGRAEHHTACTLIFPNLLRKSPKPTSLNLKTASMCSWPLSAQQSNAYTVVFLGGEWWIQF